MCMCMCVHVCILESSFFGVCPPLEGVIASNGVRMCSVCVSVCTCVYVHEYTMYVRICGVCVCVMCLCGNMNVRVCVYTCKFVCV